ncbi:hypothetical protein [Inquilinus sp. CAU 1745]|uniref:hypothetical protein n=1 Tax=Inquilinus sp. CAU 1745 TaxID=3140369 RepID=UPI00325B8C8E
MIPASYDFEGRRAFACPFAAGEAAKAYGFRIKSGMTNKNNVMLDLLQHPCGVENDGTAPDSSPPVRRRPMDSLWVIP